MEVTIQPVWVCAACRKRLSELPGELIRSLHEHFAMGIYGLELAAGERLRRAQKERMEIASRKRFRRTYQGIRKGVTLNEWRGECST